MTIIITSAGPIRNKMIKNYGKLTEIHEGKPISFLLKLLDGDAKLLIVD